MKSKIIDPWKSVCEDSSVIDVEAEGETMSSLRFEDSFVVARETEDSSCRLPDSAEYLASLESKLSKLKTKRLGKDIVKSLEEKHKSCIMNLLSNDTNQSMLEDDDFIFDTPVSSNHPLMRYVAPDKQALTVGELVELLKADHLAQVLEQQDREEDKTTQET